MTNQEAVKELVSYLSANNHLMGAVLSDECVVKSINALSAIDDIKREIFNAIDNVPITLNRNDADNLLKMDIQDIIDKHTTEITHCMAIFVNGVEH